MKKRVTKEQLEFVNSCNNRCLIFHAIGILNMYFALTSLYRMIVSGSMEEVVSVVISSIAVWVVVTPLTEIQAVRDKFIQDLPDAE